MTTPTRLTLEQVRAEPEKWECRVQSITGLDFWLQPMPVSGDILHALLPALNDNDFGDSHWGESRPAGSTGPFRKVEGG
jgi:hypothetical protein